ncbi:MAG: DUF308 domain-containing protein [Phycisphaerales bacterium]
MTTTTASSASSRLKLLGILAIFFGVFAMLSPMITGLSVVMMLGGLVAAGGIARMIWAFRSGSVGRGILMFAIGVLTLLSGLVMLANPLFASAVLTTLLAIYFVADGILEIIAGIRRRPAKGSWFLILGGIVSLLLGEMLWTQYPLKGLWALGILFGVKLLFIGMTMLAGGTALGNAAAAAAAESR